MSDELNTGTECRVRVAPLRIVVIALAVLLAVGAFISYNKATAQMFSVFGALSLPLVALLYEAALTDARRSLHTDIEQ